MKHKVLASLSIIIGVLSTSYASASDWGQVQEAGRAYYDTWKTGDKEKSAIALKNYETLAAAAYADEKAGRAVPTTFVKPAASSVSGKKLYDSTCQACHAAGLAGAPRVGDKAEWAPRIAKGESVLVEHALKGFQGKAGVMPPKGGASASDEDVKAAVHYMITASK